MRDAPGLVTLHLWGVDRRRIAWAMSRMALDRRPLRKVAGLRFARLLGTGRGRSFTPADADLEHWALLASWESEAAAEAFESGALHTGWQAHSRERWRLALRPLASIGSWSGQQPFGAGAEEPALAANGGRPYAVLTRARIVPSKLITFWRDVPPVAATLPNAPGLRFARGIGEAPVGLQATFSVWDDLASATDFAYRSTAHRRVISRTAETGWYAEQLFARFAVIDSNGAVDGRDPLNPGSSVDRKL